MGEVKVIFDITLMIALAIVIIYNLMLDKENQRLKKSLVEQGDKLRAFEAKYDAAVADLIKLHRRPQYVNPEEPGVKKAGSWREIRNMNQRENAKVLDKQ